MSHAFFLFPEGTKLFSIPLNFIRMKLPSQCIHKCFTDIINNVLWKASDFVTLNHIHHIIFAGKVVT